MLGALLGDLAGSAASEGAPSGFSEVSLCSAAVAEVLLDGADPAERMASWLGPERRRAPRPDAPSRPDLFARCPVSRASACFWLSPSTPAAILASESQAERSPASPAAVEAAGRMAALMGALHGGLDPLEIALHAGLPAPDPLAPPAADPASPLGSLETIGRALRLVREAASFEDGLRRALAAAGDPVANASIAGAFLETRFFPGEDTLQEAIARLADPENRPLGLTLLRVCLSPVARSRDPFPERRLAFAESLGLALGAPARRPAPR